MSPRRRDTDWEALGKGSQMSKRDSGGGVFGFIEGALALVGALTVMGIVAVAASVFAWEMELRKSEQETQPADSSANPSAN